MDTIQRFFFISGIIFWYLIVISIIGYFAYLVIRPIPEPKVVDFTGISFIYDSRGRKVKRRELHESMGRRGKGA